MATNRASLSDTYQSPHAEMRRAASADTANPEAPRRTGMVAGGLLLAILSLVAASLALIQVWTVPAVSDGTAQPPSGMASGEALVLIVLGGLGLAAGAALVGIGMGRWRSPRQPVNDADYTGPGQDRHDMPQPPSVI